MRKGCFWQSDQWGQWASFIPRRVSPTLWVGTASWGVGAQMLRGVGKNQSLLHATRVGLDFILSSVESCQVTGSQTEVQHTQAEGFMSAVVWRMGKKRISERAGERAAVGRQHLEVLLDACHLPLWSTLHHFLSSCLPQRLASVGHSQGYPWLLTSTWFGQWEAPAGG